MRPTSHSEPLDGATRELLRLLRASPLPPLAESTPAEIRSRLASMSRGDGIEDGVEVREASAGGVPARRYATAPSPPATIVWLHGGGWIAGRADEFDGLCGRLAASSGCEVLSVDYRLAPEDPFPAAVDDAVRALRDVLERARAEDRPVAVAGDSAGANLATVAERLVRTRTGLRTQLQALVCPLVDADFSRASYRETEGAGHVVGPAEIRMFWDHYVPDAARRAEPDCAPLRAELEGAAPAHVVVAGHDPLRDEGLEYAQALRDAGTPVSVAVYGDQIHGFIGLGALLERGRSAARELGDTIRRAIVM